MSNVAAAGQDGSEPGDGPRAISPEAFEAEARGFLEGHATRRSEEAFVWGEGSDSVGLFPERTPAQETADLAAARAWAQTVFDAGALRHRERAAKAAFTQAAEQYRSTVIAAFQNVADSLHALQQDADALKAASAATDAAKLTLDLTSSQVRAGYAGYLALLSAEQAYQQALINLVQARANRYADTAALFQALGGGWWNRPDIPKS